MSNEVRNKFPACVMILKMAPYGYLLDYIVLCEIIGLLGDYINE